MVGWTLSTPETIAQTGYLGEAASRPLSMVLAACVSLGCANQLCNARLPRMGTFKQTEVESTGALSEHTLAL